MGAPPSRHGLRQPVQLGLDVAKASQNVLRLLESSHGIHNYSVSQYQDTTSPCWHDTSGVRWSFHQKDRQWTARRANEPTTHQHSHHSHHDHTHHHHQHQMDWVSTISWLQFSDDRTALAKLQAMDGSQRYISLLRLDPEAASSSSMAANDGWVIVREVTSPMTDNGPIATPDSVENMKSLLQCLQDYLDIEHGGGLDDYQRAKDNLFAPQASLVAVGMDRADQPPSEWSAPVGTLLEVSLETYLEGVKRQIPHDPGSRRHDAIVQIDISCGGTAAAATVRVGNGARTIVFEDHLLLGRGEKDQWKILSKTFSPQLWDDDE